MKNSKTGTIDKCFDDSALVSDNNFDFLKLGGEYNCKIKLFGNVVQDMQDKTVLCEVICKDELVGTKKMVKVLVENDVYYLPVKKVKELGNIEKFYFRYTRKDLIEVNDVIHADFL